MTACIWGEQGREGKTHWGSWEGKTLWWPWSLCRHPLPILWHRKWPQSSVCWPSTSLTLCPASVLTCWGLEDLGDFRRGLILRTCCSSLLQVTLFSDRPTRSFSSSSRLTSITMGTCLVFLAGSCHCLSLFIWSRIDVSTQCCEGLLRWAFFTARLLISPPTVAGQFTTLGTVPASHFWNLGWLSLADAGGSFTEAVTQHRGGVTSWPSYWIVGTTQSSDWWRRCDVTSNRF